MMHVPSDPRIIRTCIARLSASFSSAATGAQYISAAGSPVRLLNSYASRKFLKASLKVSVDKSWHAYSQYKLVITFGQLLAAQPAQS